MLDIMAFEIILLLIDYCIQFQGIYFEKLCVSSFNHSCYIILLLLKMKLVFLLPLLIMLLTGLCLIPLFYKLFRADNNLLRQLFWWLIVVRLTTDGGWTFVMEILDDVHLRIGLTHSFVYYSGCEFIPTDGTSYWYVIIYSDLYSFVANGHCN